MDDSNMDLLTNSPLHGGGEPEQFSLKRKPSSLMSQSGDNSHDSLGRNTEDGGSVKKLKLDSRLEDSYVNCEQNGGVSSGSVMPNDGVSTAEDEATLSYDHRRTDLENGENESGNNFACDQDPLTLKETNFTRRDAVHKDMAPNDDADSSLSPTLRQSGYFSQVNGYDGSAKREEKTEELSPTLETSFDLVNSPDSPDWLQDGYYEKKIQEHASQREVLDTSGAEVSNFDKTLQYEADSLEGGDMGQVMGSAGQTEVQQVTDEVTQDDGVTFNHADVASNSQCDEKVDCSVSVAKPRETSEETVGNVMENTDLNNKGSVVSSACEPDEHAVKDGPSTSPHQNSTAAIDLTDSTPIKAGDRSLSRPSPDQITVTSDERKPESVYTNSGHSNSEAAIKRRNTVGLSSVHESAGSSHQVSVGVMTRDPAQSVVVSSGSNSHTDIPGPTAVPTLAQTDSIEQDANTIANIIGQVDIEKVLKRLRQTRTDARRVDVVLNEVLEGQLQSAIDKAEAAVIKQVQEGAGGVEDPLMADIQEVVRQVPGVDPNRVFYLLLESTSDPPNRVKTLVAQLKGRPGVSNTQEVIVVDDDPVPEPPPLKSSLSDPPDPIFAGDKLFSDMRTIAKIFPNKDRNEIYAYLEAHHDRPNRVQVVMDELLAMESQTPPVSQEVEVKGSHSVTDSVTHHPTNVQSDLQRDVDHLCMVFPDCDPNYIYTMLEQIKNVPDRTQRLAAQMFEFKTYPKLKDVLEKKSKEALKRKLINMTLNMTEFLTMFPDPVDVFLNEEKAVSEAYKEHAMTQLVNCFPTLKEKLIKEILEKRKNHFTPALRELEEEAAKYTNRHKNSDKYMKTPRQIERDFPDRPDEFFFKELLFSRHEEAIKAYIEEQRLLRAARLEEAKRDGSLMECGCCFDDECLFEDMAACTDGHLFCKECIRRSSEVRIGENKFDFPCLMDSCDHKFPVATLQSVLPHNVFSNVLRKMQEEEIRQADIPDLVSCPFCSFATIMPDPNDKVFKCLNPECLKESCRLCKEPNHIPLRCEEVEKGGETSMRTFIEDRITEAMLRTCWQCKKKFFKLDGCNKMTCTCGATMCYVCRAPNIDYGHFNEQNGCAAHTDMNELHRQEMEKAAEEAKAKYQQDNPEAAGIQLRNDPMKLIEEMRQERERQQANQMWMPAGVMVAGFNPGGLVGGFNLHGMPGVVFAPNWAAENVDNGEDYSDDEDWSDEEREDQGPSSWEEEVTDEDQDYTYLW